MRIIGMLVAVCLAASACGDKKKKIEDDGPGILAVDGCEPGSLRCLDETTALRCVSTGDGYQQTVCVSNTTCRDGWCAGLVCSIGEGSCEITGRLVTCAGGSAWQVTDCALGEACSQRTAGGVTVASCQPVRCDPWERACGDPRNRSVDTTAYASRCEQLLDGSWDWVLYNCSPPATCDPTTQRCQTDCIAGDERCSGDQMGSQQCDANGQWGPVISCTPEGASLMRCQPKPGQDPNNPADVVCSDPICHQVQFVLGQQDGGVCDGTDIRRCDTNGLLSQTAEPCPIGICDAISSSPTGGYRPASCVAQCSDGEERCLGTSSPLYQTCSAGVWSVTVQTCASGENCFDYFEGGQSKVLCGALCASGTRQCPSSTQIQTCDAQGQWGTSADCALGQCVEIGSDAGCLIECVPGELVCLGSTTLASDGVSSGTTGEGVCTAQGLLPTSPTTCPGTTTCRTTRTGIDLGCVECVGSAAPGGNASGLLDTRCDSATTLQTCDSTNDWDPAITCSNSCTTTLTSSETCISCGSGPCSNTYVLASFGFDCNAFGLGAPISCGTTPDCCGSYCITISSGLPVAFCD